MKNIIKFLIVSALSIELIGCSRPIKDDIKLASVKTADVSKEHKIINEGANIIRRQDNKQDAAKNPQKEQKQDEKTTPKNKNIDNNNTKKNIDQKKDTNKSVNNSKSPYPRKTNKIKNSVGVIEISKINVRLEYQIGHGDCQKELAESPVIMENTPTVVQSFSNGTQYRNVTIGAHRDMKGNQFQYIDKLSHGDKVIINENGHRYEYEYMESFVAHEEKDFPKVVYPNYDFNTLTLFSCIPGQGDKRLIVRFKYIK